MIEYFGEPNCVFENNILTHPTSNDIPFACVRPDAAVRLNCLRVPAIDLSG